MLPTREKKGENEENNLLVVFFIFFFSFFLISWNIQNLQQGFQAGD